KYLSACWELRAGLDTPSGKTPPAGFFVGLDHTTRGLAAGGEMVRSATPMASRLAFRPLGGMLPATEAWESGLTKLRPLRRRPRTTVAVCRMSPPATLGGPTLAPVLVTTAGGVIVTLPSRPPVTSSMISTPDCTWTVTPAARELLITSHPPRTRAATVVALVLLGDAGSSK